MKVGSVRYDVDLSAVDTQQLKVAMTVDLEGAEPIDLVMPAVSPGSPTNSQDQPARLSRLSVEDAEGNPVGYSRLSSGEWRLEDVKGPVRVSYTLRADEMSHVRAHLSHEHAYLNGPATFLYVKGRERDLPAEIHFHGKPDPSWQVLSNLPGLTTAPDALYAHSYEEIADSNIEVAHLHTAEAHVKGTRVIVNQHGTPPWKHLDVNGATPEQNLEDFSKLYRVFLHHFGEFPGQRYLVSAPQPAHVDGEDRYVINKHYIHTGSSSAGGFEHYHGHELLMHKDSERGIQRVYNSNGRSFEAQVMAHEVGHKLLAKLVRHEGIDSADLSQQVPTDGLWLTEGVTDWMGVMLERQAGLISAQDYLERQEHEIERYLADYELDPSNARDNSLSACHGNSKFYNKGHLTGTVLDLTLRRLSGGEKSLFDVLRELKHEFGGTGQFHTLEHIERLACKVVGEYPGAADEVSRLFNRHLRDREPLDFDAALESVGYRLELVDDAWEPGSMPLGSGSLQVDERGVPSLTQTPSEAGPFPLSLPSLGLSLAQKDGKLTVSVGRDGPAFEAGLKEFSGKTPEAMTLTEDGMRFVFKRTSQFTGQESRVELFVPVTPALRPRIVEVDEPTPQQLALRAAWLAELPLEAGRDPQPA